MSKVTKSRLGRGLSSLITPQIQVELPPPEADASGQTAAGRGAERHPPSRTAAGNQAPTGTPLEINVDSIQPNPHQPRRTIDESKIAELAASLKSTGLVQPIVVRRKNDGYELIAGERRWRAAKHAGLRTIPAIVRDVTSLEQAQMALIENIQRENLNPIERAQSYRALIDQLGLTQSELAMRLGEDRSSIANHLRLLDLTPPVRDAVQTGALSLGHAKLLAAVEDPSEQERLASLTRSQDLSVRNLERLMAGGKNESAPSATRDVSAPTLSPHFRDLEQNLARQLGLRVQLAPSAKKGRGKITFHYASLDQFDVLMSRLGVDTE